MRFLGLLLLTSVFACGDESISGYADREATYRLETLFGEPFGPRATLRFPEEGVISGEAPCNGFSGTQTAPYPWFAPERIAVTRRTCPDQGAETAFLSGLAEMTLAEVQGPVLILSDEDGREMVFRAE